MMPILIGLVVVALGGAVWVLDWSVGGADASTIGVILIVLGGMIILASRLVSERAAVDRTTSEEPRSDWATPGIEETPEDEARRFRAGQPPAP
jgi:hypothetical protein